MAVIVFDLDGTLADTSADLIAAANACFRELNLGAPLDPVQDALTAFHGGRAMLRLGFERLGMDETLVDAQYPVLLAAYARGICDQTTLYPGATEAVRMLRATGYATAICTNKPASLAETLVQALGIRDLFDALVGADTLPVRKPDPAPYHLAVAQAGGGPSMLIGDTQTDRDTGRAAGVPVALVTFGPEGGAIARLAPDALLDRYADLPDLALRLLPHSPDTNIPRGDDQ